ncbi:MAG: hypothetical protein RX318_11280 [bacterium]|nr:hypothetical protein [bacterium]
MKLIITGFLGFMLIGYFLNLVMTISTIGLTYGSIVSYYLGSKTEMAFPKTYRHLLEVSHFHLFIMPLILLTVSHLFFSPLGRPGAKSGSSSRLLLLWAARCSCPGSSGTDIAPLLS